MNVKPGTFLSQNIPHLLPVLSDVDIMFFNSILVLTPNGQFFYFATTASSERRIFLRVHFFEALWIQLLRTAFSRKSKSIA